MAGQVSLFDLGDEGFAKAKQYPLPNVEEFPKEELLTYEKEVMGIYVSGHPLEEYVALMKKIVPVFRPILQPKKSRKTTVLQMVNVLSSEVCS